MSKPVDLRNPGRQIHVGVVLLNSTTEILDVAPVDALNGLRYEFIKDLPPEFLSDEMKAQTLDIAIHWVTETGAPPAKLTSNTDVMPTDSFATCPPLDIILMGAAAANYQATPGELDFLRKCEPTAAAFLLICGGFLPVLEAGLLQGKTATAPRPLLPIVDQLRLGKKTNWVEKRWTRDGKIWTTGALLNGLDMMAAFTREYWGGEGSLAEQMLRVGGFPLGRDVDYKDVSWKV